MDKAKIRKKFKQALKDSKIYLCYQPQYNHSTHQMVGAESLMRWRDDEEGEQYPSDFIPILEESGIIYDADIYVFEEVCKFLRKCIDKQIPVVPISFNISRYDIYGHNYVEAIESIRRKYEVSPEYLRAEITESSAIGGPELVNEVLTQLHEYGYVVEMDDFGTGYSSLNILKDLDVDIIKLDMRFLSGEITGRGGLILNSIIQMSKWLNTPMIAEGVETMTQADFIKSLGCNYIQGYLYAKPMKEEDFIVLLKSSTIENEQVTNNEKPQMDVYRFFDPESAETAFFNSYVGPAVICSYEEGKIEIIRANDKYFKETFTDIKSKNAEDIFGKENMEIYRETMEKAIESNDEEIFETQKTIFGPCETKTIYLKSCIHVIGNISGKVVLYIATYNITNEKEIKDDIKENEIKFRYASEHTGTYSWEYDIKKKEMRPCSLCRRDLGLPELIENYPEPVLGNLFPWDYADMYREWHRKLSNGEKHLKGIIPLTEHRIPYIVEYTTVFDRNGQPVKAYGSAIKKEMYNDNISFEMAYTLAKTHVCTYEVNLETEHFVVFYSDEANRTIIGDIEEGENFFDFIHKHALKNVVQEDRKKAEWLLTKNNIMNELKHSGKFTLTLCVVFRNKPEHIQIQANYINENCIAVILDNVSRSIHEKEAYAEARTNNDMYLQVTKALSKDYINLYYIDIKTEKFIEYIQDGENVIVRRKGEDFFNSCTKDAKKVIHKDDIDMFFNEFRKEKIIEAVKKGEVVTITYRLLQNEEYIYAGMKISGTDGKHLIIGVSDISEQMNHEKEMRKIEEERTVYSRFFALTGNYICMYIVEEDGSYTEYNATEDYRTLNVPVKGTDFFAEAIKNSRRIVFMDDMPLVEQNLNEWCIRDEISKNGFFALEYRIIIEGKPTYVSVKAVEVNEDGKRRLIIGMSDIDAYVRRKKKFNAELARANMKANIDALTNVKNKHAYIDAEEELNEQIRNGTAKFGIAVFDVNGLKRINDTLGHQKGDEYLKEACSIICTIFKHSPVFRVGGDEFAAILKGHDYEFSGDLSDEIMEHNKRNMNTDRATVACGIAKYENDTYVSDVFRRADKVMYDEKSEFHNDCP